VDKHGNIIPMNPGSEAAMQRGELVLTEIPQEELEDVVRMNRAQRRMWLKQFKKRGKGYTK